MQKVLLNLILMLLVILTVCQKNTYALDTLINGFITQGYIKTDNNNMYTDSEDGSFEFNEMGIRFSTLLPDRLRIGMQFFARDLGDLGNDEITIDWAFSDYLLMNQLGFRAGNLKNSPWALQ